MSLVKISQYSKDSLPEELKTKLAGLSREAESGAVEEQSTETGTQSSSFLFTASTQNTLLGFAEVSIRDQVVTIDNIFIDPPYRGKRIGNKLVLHLLAKSVKWGADLVQLSFKKRALVFFKHAGFLVAQEPQDSEHPARYLMENPCPEFYLSVLKQALSAHKRKQTKWNPPLIIAQDPVKHNYHTELQWLALHRSMLGQARRKIWLMCDAINASVLNNSYTRQAMFRLVRQNPSAEIKILLANDKSGAGYFNQTLDLAQRLSSYIEIRTLKHSGLKINEVMTLVDHSACIYRKNLSGHSGFANFSSLLQAQKLEHNFEYYWQFAKPSLELRKLTI